MEHTQNSAAADEPLWNMTQTARYLAVSKTTLKAWMDSGTIPFVQFSERVYRFVPSVVRAWRPPVKPS